MLSYHSLLKEFTQISLTIPLIDQRTRVLVRFTEQEKLKAESRFIKKEKKEKKQNLVSALPNSKTQVTIAEII